MRIYTIYKATNKNNDKAYIGFDSKWPKRQKEHHQATGNCRKFHAAIKKYGWESFEWDILFQGWDEKFVAEFVEPYLIHEHNTVHSGYNLMPGGRINRVVHSDETKQKLRALRLGKKATNETRQKMSQQRKGQPKSESHKQKISLGNMGKSKGLGIPKSEEHRQKISLALKGRIFSEEMKTKLRIAQRKRRARRT